MSTPGPEYGYDAPVERGGCSIPEGGGAVKRTLRWSAALVVVLLLLLAIVSSALAQTSLSAEKVLAANLAEDYRPFIEKVGKTVWEFAETGLNEYRSAKFLTDELEKLGFQVERGVAQFPTAFVATFTEGTGGPVIGLLAEYDALPSLSPVTPGGNGHGCGHNLYCAGAVGTAAVLKQVMQQLHIPGTIKVFGTPAEETFDGKAWMGRQGVLKGVDVFFGCHADSSNTVPFGSNLAMDYKIYTFHGKSSHAGAAPEKGISALDAAEIMDVAVNFLREHVPSDVRIHYIIRQGGEAANVVPSLVKTEYFIRAPERALVDEVGTKVDNCARAGALAAGCTVDIELVSALHNKIPNRAGTLLAWENLKLAGAAPFDAKDQEAAKALGFTKGLSTELTAPPEEPSLSHGSSDEGDVSWNAPLLNFSLANYAQGTAGHSLELAKQANMPAAYKGVVQNVKVMAFTALDLLTKPDELKKVKDEFAATMKDRKYDPGSKVMLDLKHFPEPPGVTATAPDTVAFQASETVFDEVAGTVVNVYANQPTGQITGQATSQVTGETKIGSLTLNGREKSYTIKTQVQFKPGDILVIKYQQKGKPEILYGYVKKF